MSIPARKFFVCAEIAALWDAADAGDELAVTVRSRALDAIASTLQCVSFLRPLVAPVDVQFGIVGAALPAQRSFAAGGGGAVG